MGDVLLIYNKIVKEDLEEIYSRNIPWEQMDGKTVLITGPYGMLSSYMTAMLIYLNEEKEYNIRIIAVVKSIEKFQKRFGEYVDRSYVRVVPSMLDGKINIKGDVDYIIHAASYASGNYYKLYPVDTMKPNVLGTYYLLELAKEKQSDGFLFFSSGDIYGKIIDLESISETDIGVLDTLDEHSCYGESKRLAETMCRAYYNQYKVPAMMLRIFPTYAPTMDIQNDPRAVATFVKDVVNGNDIVLKSSGAKRMSFCYIADAIAGYFMVLLKGVRGDAYNVCNSKEFYQVKELAEIIASLSREAKSKVVMIPRSIDEPYIENDFQSWLRPSDEKLRNLGWKPHFDTKAGFKRVIDYFTLYSGKSFERN